MTPSPATILRELARARAEFQARAVEALLREEPQP